MLEPDDLLTPRGRLHAAALWPSGTSATGYDEGAVFDKLEKYLQLGYEAYPARDDVVKPWAEWKALDEVYQVRVLMPASVGRDEGSTAYTDQQRAELKTLRDEAWAEYQLALAPVKQPNTRQSASSAVEYRW